MPSLSTRWTRGYCARCDESRHLLEQGAASYLESFEQGVVSGDNGEETHPKKKSKHEESL
eukprot:1056309-Prymnesium_polylepis.1